MNLRFLKTQSTFTVVSQLLLLTSVFAQSDDLAPRDNLVTEGIPKIPASLPTGVGRYTKGRRRVPELASDPTRNADRHLSR